jgi:hypothetical protein
MMPKAYVIHRARQRVRLRVPEYRKVVPFFYAVEERLRGVPEIALVETNPVTAGILIRYRGEFSRVVEIAKEQDLFEIETAEMVYRPWVRRVFDELDELDDRVRKSTDDKFDLTSLVGVAFLGLGVSQILKRQYLPPAASLIADGLKLLAQVSAEQSKKKTT